MTLPKKLFVFRLPDNGNVRLDHLLKIRAKWFLPRHQNQPKFSEILKFQ